MLQRALFEAPGAALDLAVFRVTVALVLASSGSVRVAVDWAALPTDARVTPLGLGWLLPHLAVTPASVEAVRALLYASCLSSALGLFTRCSCVVMAGTAFYVLLVPQLGGAVFHDHHLLWFAALLAASPCGDALSLDAWRARRRGTPRPTGGVAHGLALRSAWLMVGLIYFFPGVHKLRAMGLGWVLGDNLQHQLWWKWALDPSLVPRFRVDHHPLLLHALAGFTVLFELGFVFGVFWRRTRLWAVAAALAFHAGTHWLMGIDFAVLYLCYTVFLPWSEWLGGRLGPGHSEHASAHASGGGGPVRRLAVVALPLVLGVATAGGLGAMQAYPFACYPTFARDPGASMPALRVVVRWPDGRTELLSPGWYRTPGPRGVALEWRLLGAYGDFSEARLRAWWFDVARRPGLRERLAGGCQARFSRVRVSVDPDAPDTRDDGQRLAELPCLPTPAP